MFVDLRDLEKFLQRIATAQESIDKTEKLRLVEDQKQTLALQGIEKLLQESSPGVVASFKAVAGIPISKGAK